MLELNPIEKIKFKRLISIKSNKMGWMKKEEEDNWSNKKKTPLIKERYFGISHYFKVEFIIYNEKRRRI